MARQKEYDRDEALQKAMEVFWSKGFEATSVQDLVDATGLNRFSMYSAFGSKEGLLEQALVTYRERVTSLMLAPLEDPSLRGLASVRQFLGAIRAYFTSPGGSRGCLFINTAVEAPLREKGAVDQLTAHFLHLEKGLEKKLREAVAEGELPTKADLPALAQSLVALVIGSGVLARGPLSQAGVTGAMDGALALLEAYAKR